jgi:hypothetical protein
LTLRTPKGVGFLLQRPLPPSEVLHGLHKRFSALRVPHGELFG